MVHWGEKKIEILRLFGAIISGFGRGDEPSNEVHVHGFAGFLFQLICHKEHSLDGTGAGRKGVKTPAGGETHCVGSWKVARADLPRETLSGIQHFYTTNLCSPRFSERECTSIICRLAHASSSCLEENRSHLLSFAGSNVFWVSGHCPLLYIPGQTRAPVPALGPLGSQKPAFLGDAGSRLAAKPCEIQWGRFERASFRCLPLGMTAWPDSPYNGI